MRLLFAQVKEENLWEDNLIKAITDFAKNNKCKRLSIMARPGWEKSI